MPTGNDAEVPSRETSPSQNTQDDKSWDDRSQNHALAQAFAQIADYLDLAGDNPFKIRAYRRAAEAVADYPQRIEDAAENGQLESIEGLGQATVAKTREFLATGTIRLLEYLKSEYPPGLLDLGRVPGLGAKKVSQLYKERDIDSLEKFAEALHSGKLAGLSGFGPKTIENLKIALRRMAELSSRLPISGAVPLAEKLKAALRERVGDLDIHDAGSLRRGVETVGNLNFVARTNEPARVLDAFASLPLVVEVVAREENRLVARVPQGLEIEVVTTAPERFGNTLFFHTGSRAHLEAIEVPTQDCADESEVYARLGASWVPPEMREGHGEWEAARGGTLPMLVQPEDVRGDLHTHSTWSDGVATIRQQAQAVRDLGYAYFAVTDHSKALAMANGLNAERLREQALEIAEVQAEFPQVRIFRGIECDILRDGRMDLDDEILSELDFVIGSVHSAFNLSLEAQTERMIKAIQNPLVDLIAHPTGRVLGVRAPYDVDVPALIEAATETGTALEINASERLDLKYEYAMEARQKGVLLAVNTDAHSPKMFANLRYGIWTARRAWCEPKHLLNTKSVEELEPWLKGRNGK